MSNLRTDLFTQEEIKSFIKYDPEAAKKVLAEAGYPDGFSIEFMYNDGGNEAYKEDRRVDPGPDEESRD